MQGPNETQAINLTRRLRADPLLPEAQEAAKALIGKIQGAALGMTVQGVMRVAIWQHPEAGVFAAIERLGQDVERAQANEGTLKSIFDAAEVSEEQRLAPFDAACAKRIKEIQTLLEAAHLDHRSKIMNQDLPERRYRSYVNKGLTAAEIKALDIPEPNYGRDFVAERNQWGFELEQATQVLTTERDAILRFKHSRNENALPASVLALVESEAQKVTQ